MIWQRTAEETVKLGVGSRYKTPNLPVWVSCVNGSWGVLFNPNKDLLKSHSAENRSHGNKMIIHHVHMQNLLNSDEEKKINDTKIVVTCVSMQWHPFTISFL